MNIQGPRPTALSAAAEARVETETPRVSLPASLIILLVVLAPSVVVFVLIVAILGAQYLVNR